MHRLRGLQPDMCSYYSRKREAAKTRWLASRPPVHSKSPAHFKGTMASASDSECQASEDGASPCAAVAEQAHEGPKQHASQGHSHAHGHSQGQSQGHSHVQSEAQGAHSGHASSAHHKAVGGGHTAAHGQPQETAQSIFEASAGKCISCIE